MKKSFRFEKIAFHAPHNLASGTFLWIWNADKIPPHIGISRGQNYFSLTVRGVELQKNVSSMLRKAKRRELPLVLVPLDQWKFEKDFTSVFSRYEKIVAEQTSCLSPITELMGLGGKVVQLADLLETLENSGSLKEVFALHLASDYSGIPAYDYRDIISRIEELNEA